jgi:hypothetical protein
MIKRLVFVLAMLGASAAASAQVSYSGLDHINRIIAGASGVTAIGITDAVAVSASGVASVAVGSINVAVPATATATLGKAAMAKAAARFVVGLGSGVGIALTGYDIYNWYIDSGYKPCPISSGAIFCKSAIAPSTVITGYFDDGANAPEGGTLRYSTKTALCDVWKTARGFPSYTIIPQSLINGYTDNGICQYMDPNNGAINEWYHSKTAATCPTNYTLSAGVCNYTGPAPAPVGNPYSPAELEDLTVGPSPNWDANRSKRMYDALVKDKQYQNHQAELWPSGTPLAWTAPPVTSPSKVVETVTYPAPAPAPAGQTETKKTEVVATVSPQAAGPTFATPGLNFPSSTVTTVTTTNNTTLVSNVSTVNNTLAAPVAALDFPTDYNREVTQQKIEADLNTDAAVLPPDQSTRIDAAKTSGDTGITQAVTDAKTGQADKSAWFSWVWTPPVGVCSPFSGTVHGYSVAWDACPTFTNFRDVLGWLFALFGAIQIYGQLFKKV